MSKKILIIGNSATSYALSKKLSADNEVFVIPGNDAIKEFATCVDIRENSITEILDFVLENEIELTIPISKMSLSTNIVDCFNQNNLNIFAPSKEALYPIIDKANTKKVLYKLRIPTPKFGIFEKQNMALDYIKNLKKPFIIKTNDSTGAVILTSAKMAKNIIESGFAQNSQKIIIEDYIQGSTFSFYVITDGYKALPIGSSLIYKHSLEGNGGQLTNGQGACSPNYKLSNDNEYYLMDNVIYPLLEYLESTGSPYTGILGVNAILTEDNLLQVIGFEPFLQNCDSTAILEILDESLVKLMEACIIGAFSDDIEYISLKDICATSIVLSCKNKDNKENAIMGLDSLDETITACFYPSVRKNKYLEFEAQYGPVLSLTATGRTVSSATQNAYDEVENISFNGLSFRKDICKTCRI